MTHDASKMLGVSLLELPITWIKPGEAADDMGKNQWGASRTDHRQLKQAWIEV